jgi:hypothetical protein
MPKGMPFQIEHPFRVLQRTVKLLPISSNLRHVLRLCSGQAVKTRPDTYRESFGKLLGPSVRYRHTARLKTHPFKVLPD